MPHVTCVQCFDSALAVKRGKPGFLAKTMVLNDGHPSGQGLDVCYLKYKFTSKNASDTTLLLVFRP